jgi:hypothetical protein
VVLNGHRHRGLDHIQHGIRRIFEFAFNIGFDGVSHDGVNDDGTQREDEAEGEQITEEQFIADLNVFEYSDRGHDLCLSPQAAVGRLQIPGLIGHFRARVMSNGGCACRAHPWQPYSGFESYFLHNLLSGRSRCK